VTRAGANGPLGHEARARLELARRG
jgi:hypothetical protein